MRVAVEAGSPVPPYEQLRAQIAGLVASGGLPAGRRLPPIRQLAADLAIAPGTVARAYRELEQAGLVVSRGRRGTRVVDHPPVEVPPDTRGRLQAAAERFAATAQQLGAAPEDALALVRHALEEGAAVGAPVEAADRAPAAPNGTAPYGDGERPATTG
ncbi:GntR family transcriptional regulator [Egicoccus halophilus]|uniref:GntR family transcriptional regulator n=1 Tax=Egicoccus halophilus TaxID=1670830 RepID=A0A8J3EXZ4_9ACTN|nr:GntR family transcriptional regulator [Egicoccus halophilus]GGI06823.1 GntR family transcriptional regulator [Egicoccus halophilus]